MDQNDDIKRPTFFDLASLACDNCESNLAELWCGYCYNYYCPTCCSDIHKYRAFSNHQPTPLDRMPLEIVLCANCSKKEYEFQCYDCSVVICGDCLLSEHKSHKFIYINEMTRERVVQTASDIESTQVSLDESLNQALKDIDKVENINKKKIRKAFAALHAILDEHEAVLQKQILTFETKNKNLIEHYQRQLISTQQKTAQDQNKILAIALSKQDYENQRQIKSESRNSFYLTLDDFSFLKPPVRIIYKIEGLEQLNKIGQMLKQIYIIEEELRLDKTPTYRNYKFERLLADRNDCEKLTLRSQQLNDKDIIIMAHFLQGTTTLTNLNLSMNKIGANGVHSLTTALLTNTTLQKLNLSQNHLGDQGTRYLADLLCENKTLTKLYLDENQIGSLGAKHLADALKTNQALAILFLSENNVGDEGTKYLADALQINKTLDVLNLCGNQIGPNGVKQIARALGKNNTLSGLYLSRNLINDEGAMHLAKAFQKDAVLSALYIADNGISQRGAQYLIDALRENVTLTKLDCELNQIGNDMSRHIQEIISIIAACKRDKDMEDIRRYRKKSKTETSK